MRQALLGTWPGRVTSIGAAIKVVVFAIGLAVPLPAWLSTIDTLASVVVAIGALYFLGRALAVAQRRVLWRVRRKLILSYIFIGFIPSILIVTFFLLGGWFLFVNFSSYLLQSEFRALNARAMAVAGITALDVQRAGGRNLTAILAGRQSSRAAAGLPGYSQAVIPMARPCSTSAPDAPAESVGRVATSGPWAHVDPPAAVPEWLSDCRGFGGIFPYQQADAANGVGLFVRAVAFAHVGAASYAVIIDIPFDEQLRRQLRATTGVDVRTFQSRSPDIQPLPGRAAPPRSAAAAPASDLPLSSFSFLEEHDWQTGARGSVIATMHLSIRDIYRHISAQASAEASRVLLLILIAIGILFFIIQAFAVIAGLALARSITRSVHTLFEGTERVRQGDFSHKMAIVARDQLGELAASFNSMTASIEDLLREQAEKKRLEEELRIAHEIQMSLLPHGPLGVPGLSVTALSVPAREVGGDYYDFFPIDANRVGVLIADVSGKGTSAALYMAELKGLMLSLSRIHTSPRDLLVAANQIIAEHLDPRSFITMTYAVFDLRARTMIYARAGHTPLMYLSRAASMPALHVLAPDGLVVGLKVDNGETFERLLEEVTMPIHEGDLLLLFTDGITEAMNAQDDCFGEGRLGRLVEQHARLSDEELRERVLREISSFVGDVPQHDDMTLLILRVGEPVRGASISAEVVAAART
jgi:sigma-B regulation protein RsbU (phosphoserine phosphatase)